MRTISQKLSLQPKGSTRSSGRYCNLSHHTAMSHHMHLASIWDCRVHLAEEDIANKDCHEQGGAPVLTRKGIRRCAAE